MGLFSQDEDESQGLFTEPSEGPRRKYGPPTSKTTDPKFESELLTGRSLSSIQTQVDLTRGKRGPLKQAFDGKGSLFGPEEPPQTIEMDTVASRISEDDTAGVASNTLEFLFGPELGLIGIAHDAEGWSWQVDNIQQQWSENPLWVNALAATSLVGSLLLPSAMAVRSSMKFGKLASKAGKIANEADEIGKWKTMGLIADQNVNTYSQLGGNYEKTIQMLRKQEVALTRYEAMKARAQRAANGDLTWGTPVEKVQHEFDKRFAQSYNAVIGNAGNGDIKSQFHAMHDELWKEDTIGTLLSDMPDEKSGPAIYAYLMGRNNPALSGKAKQRFGSLSEKDKLWADVYYEAAKKRQTQMLEDGFITPETYKAIGDIHLPAQFQGTGDPMLDVGRQYMVPVSTVNKRRGISGIVAVEEERKGLGRLFGKTKTKYVPEGEFEYVPIKLDTRPRLDSSTMMHREGTQDEIFERLISGDLLSDPADFTVRGYMMDGLLHSNFSFVRDLATDSRFIATADNISEWGGNAKKAAKAGFVSLEYAPSGASATLRRMIAKKTGKPEEALPWIRKEIFDDIFGKEGMMAQTNSAAGDMMDVMTTIYKTMKTAGSIPTHLQNLTGNMIFLSQAGFNPVAPANVKLMGQVTNVFNRVAEINSAGTKAGLKGRSLFDKNTGMLKGVDLGKIKVGGKTFNMNEEMFDPIMRDLIEESAFESVEGSGHLVNILSRLREDQHATKGMIKLYMKGKNAAQLGGKAPWFDKLTKAYLGEDMVPKMAYFLHLRGQGLSRQAAATEVARRLPMYGTVGSAIKGSRRFAFPWATFPAEAVRITKNNIQDHPLRMIPWLKAPQLMQSAFSAMGYSEGPRGVAETKKQLPFWAQSPTTVVTEADTGAVVGGGMTGAIVGGALGAAVTRSAGGAYAGMGAGAILAAMTSAFTTSDEAGEQMRGAMMDFLPHSTFMMTTNSVDFGGEYLPFKDLKGAIEQSPAEPLAILKPLVAAFSGETPYGEPVGRGTVGSGLAKTFAGMVGFLAPPLIQKYGLKLTTPDVPLWGEPTGITNVSRFLTDTGQAIDPMTGRPGSMSHDFLLNNFGAWKSYSATAEQQLANEAMADRNLEKVRNNLTKNLKYHLENQNERDVVRILSNVQATFANQYVYDPLLAQNKYTAWLERHAKTLGRHPKLRGWSEEELIARLEEAGELAGYARSSARNKLIDTLRTELMLKGNMR
jgi:hypothetical protein